MLFFVFRFPLLCDRSGVFDHTLCLASLFLACFLHYLSSWLQLGTWSFDVLLLRQCLLLDDYTTIFFFLRGGFYVLSLDLGSRWIPFGSVLDLLPPPAMFPRDARIYGVV